jgi:NAD(P)-dependent dehydrogenase (short-subunit alcohol dehydrogenase family)
MTINSESGKGSVIVFGATGGIGSEVCRRLLKNHTKVYLVGHHPDKLEILARETGAEGLTVDATEPEEVKQAFESAYSALGPIEGVVNCIGSVLLKPAHLTTWTDWQTTLALNLGTAFSVVREGSRAIMSAGGSIVLMSSAAARIGLPNHEAIAAAKAGIIGLVRSAAATYAARRIRINAVAPGLVQTPLTEKITSNERSRGFSLALHPLGRLGEASDIASAIVWLLSSEQSWVTGQVIGVDGGLGTLTEILHKPS